MNKSRCRVVDSTPTELRVQTLRPGQLGAASSRSTVALLHPLPFCHFLVKIVYIPASSARWVSRGYSNHRFNQRLKGSGPWPSIISLSSYISSSPHTSLARRSFCKQHVPQRSEGNKVDCQSFRCRYSDLHPTACGNCATTCTQWLKPARMVANQNVASPCRDCLQVCAL
ncbi:hypothetical protein AB1N83_001904 [Pleurotus pulmonarius]